MSTSAHNPIFKQNLNWILLNSNNNACYYYVKYSSYDNHYFTETMLMFLLCPSFRTNHILIK